MPNVRDSCRNTRSFRAGRKSKTSQCRTFFDEGPVSHEVDVEG